MESGAERTEEQEPVDRDDANLDGKGRDDTNRTREDEEEDGD